MTCQSYPHKWSIRTNKSSVLGFNLQGGPCPRTWWSRGLVLIGRGVLPIATLSGVGSWRVYCYCAGSPDEISGCFTNWALSLDLIIGSPTSGGGGPPFISIPAVVLRQRIPRRAAFAPRFSWPDSTRSVNRFLIVPLGALVALMISATLICPCSAARSRMVMPYHV